LTPVRLPPGRFRLATSPDSTGSTPTLKTIGMVVVAVFAASAAATTPAVTITSTWRRTKSAARAGSRSSYLLSAQRYSITTFWPSIKPVSCSPWRTAAVAAEAIVGLNPARNPPTGPFGCCACVATDATVPPKSAMNARRFICPTLRPRRCREYSSAQHSAHWLLHRNGPVWATAAVGHLQTKLMVCEGSIVGLLLLHQRTRRPPRPPLK